MVEATIIFCLNRKKRHSYLDDGAYCHVYLLNDDVPALADSFCSHIVLSESFCPSKSCWGIPSFWRPIHKASSSGAKSCPWHMERKNWRVLQQQGGWGFEEFNGKIQIVCLSGGVGGHLFLFFLRGKTFLEDQKHSQQHPEGNKIQCSARKRPEQSK